MCTASWISSIAPLIRMSLLGSVCVTSWISSVTYWIFVHCSLDSYVALWICVNRSLDLCALLLGFTFWELSCPVFQTHVQGTYLDNAGHIILYLTFCFSCLRIYVHWFCILGIKFLNFSAEIWLWFAFLDTQLASILFLNIHGFCKTKQEDFCLQEIPIGSPSLRMRIAASRTTKQIL